MTPPTLQNGVGKRHCDLYKTRSYTAVRSSRTKAPSDSQNENVLHESDLCLPWLSQSSLAWASLVCQLENAPHAVVLEGTTASLPTFAAWRLVEVCNLHNLVDADGVPWKHAPLRCLTLRSLCCSASVVTFGFPTCVVPTHIFDLSDGDGAIDEHWDLQSIDIAIDLIPPSEVMGEALSLLDVSRLNKVNSGAKKMAISGRLEATGLDESSSALTRAVDERVLLTLWLLDRA